MGDLQNELLRAGLITEEQFQAAQEAMVEIHRDVGPGRTLLKSDGTNKGPHSVHLKSHRKLGKHRTVINAAHLFVSEIISLRQLKTIHLGKIIFHRGQQLPGLTIRRVPGRIRLVIVDSVVMQVIRLEARSFEEQAIQAILRRLAEVAESLDLAIDSC